MMRFKTGEKARLAYVMKECTMTGIVGREVVVERIGPWPAWTQLCSTHPEFPDGWQVHCRMDYVVRFVDGPRAGKVDGVQDSMLLKLGPPAEVDSTISDEVTA
jgi:hypothetical protein